MFWVENDSIEIRGTIVITNDNEEPFKGKLAIKDIESIEIKNLDGLATGLVVGSVVGCAVILILLAQEIPHAPSGGSCSSNTGGRWFY